MKDRVFGYATSLYHVSYVLLVLEFIFALLGLGDAEYHFFSSQSNLSAFLLGFIISVITTWGINCYVKQKTFPLKYLTSNRYTVLSLALMAVCVALSLNFIEDDMLCIPTYIELIGAIFYIVAYKAIQLITRKRTYGSFQKPKELKMDPMKVECRNSLKRGFVNGLLDRYERLNKKRLRKGKQPLTREEYMVVLHEDHHKMKVVSVVMLVVFMIALTMLVLFVTRNDPVNEKFIFAGILSLFEAPVIYFFCIRFMIGRDMRTKLFRELDELQIDIFDYNERLNIIE